MGFCTEQQLLYNYTLSKVQKLPQFTCHTDMVADSSLKPSAM